jgi:hypothetical protein
MYRQPLSEESLQAISMLSEVAVEKGKMKDKKYKMAYALGDSSVVDSVGPNKKKKVKVA